MINKILCFILGHEEYESLRYDCWYLFKCRRCSYTRTIGPCDECLMETKNND